MAGTFWVNGIAGGEGNRGYSPTLWTGEEGKNGKPTYGKFSFSSVRFLPGVLAKCSNQNKKMYTR